ncbi:hypothetical protein EDC18_11110 [Natranaerovirga pectinivora]|uniref:Uncharacterized protein n=1 Tax=Natranaerovirga pectinivora TaxID=682400 RepID=A0A4R3MLR4_9FIRM|nr:hypothetical protein [Natranaerovirga pectinivora]TCT12839.1 hypothetical protein EDC18_11110 [Natranaerovirga pectinivora]
MSPLPLIKPSGVLIYTLAKKAWNWLKNAFNRTAKEAGEIESITGESAIEDIAKINDIFNGFKGTVDKEIIEIEEKILEEISVYASELCFVVETNKALLGKYNINLNRFLRQIEKLKTGINGLMQKEISKRVSLDNPECKNTVKMLPGAKKEEAFKVLLESATNAGIDAVNEKVEEIISDIMDDFEFMLNDCIEQLEKDIQSQMVLLSDEEMASKDIVELKEEIKSKSTLIIDMCNVIENIINEEV